MVRRAVPMAAAVSAAMADRSPVLLISGIPNSPVHARTDVRDSREGRSTVVSSARVSAEFEGIRRDDARTGG
jgi:hypothetical protein